jgi:hypothetical protein
LGQLFTGQTSASYSSASRGTEKHCTAANGSLIVVGGCRESAPLTDPALLDALISWRAFAAPFRVYRSSAELLGACRAESHET